MAAVGHLRRIEHPAGTSAQP